MHILQENFNFCNIIPANVRYNLISNTQLIFLSYHNAQVDVSAHAKWEFNKNFKHMSRT